MATVDTSRTASGRGPAGEEPRAPPDGPEPIRVPRLLVVASEISWRLLVCVAAGALVVYAFVQVGFVAFPVLIALLLSTLFVPPARWLQCRGLGPGMATVVVFVAGVLVLAGVAAIVVEGIASQSGELSDQLKSGVDELGQEIAALPLGLDEAEVQRQIDSIDDRIREHSDEIRNGALAGAAQAGQLLGALAITLVVLFFFVKDGPALWSWCCRRFPPARRAAVDELGQRTWDVLSAYVRGVVFVAFVDAVGIGIGLFVLGVPLVVPLAVLTFILAFVPIVGAIAAGAAAVLVAFVADGVITALLVLGVVVLVQQLESNVLYPWIVGRTVELHPVVVLLAVAAGGVLYGIVGAAVAVPVALIATAVAQVVGRHGARGEVEVGPPQPAAGGGPPGPERGAG
jgi:predicted PurR-regulated permease PerM